MNVANMREWVANAYSGEQWKKKVKQMSDSQIIALYHSLVARGKIKN